MASDDWVLSHLFLAAPRIFINKKTLRRLYDIGLLDDNNYQALKSSADSIDKLIGKGKQGKRLIDRILAINPEALDEDFINLLRLGGLITKNQAHSARLMYRAQEALRVRPRDANAMTRFVRLFGVGYSEETVNFMLSTGVINKYQREAFLSVMLAGNRAKELPQIMRKAKSWGEMMALSAEWAVDAETFRLLKYAGLLNKEVADGLAAAVAMGKTNWRQFQGAKRVDGLAQRMLYVSTGSFNYETVRFLKAVGLINRREELLLRVGVQISSAYHRKVQENWTQRRYRPRLNERPIKTFANASKRTDAELLRLLAVSAKDASKKAGALDTRKGIGAQSRARQLKSVTAALHDEMQALWEGQGYLTIIGQREAALAAAEANEAFIRKLTRRGFSDQDRFMLAYNARNGIDQYISRQENHYALSRRVYRNMDLYTGKVDEIVNRALLTGLSPRELAAEVASYIRPSTPGGVSYAAMRLARTEINNAFHITSMRYMREQPWVEAVKWNLSGSHGRPDVCNDYAEKDHGLGQAGYFRKSQVPGKPHPQCLCYITAVTIDDDTFFRYYQRGYFSRYLRDNAPREGDAMNSWLHDGVQRAFSASTG